MMRDMQAMSANYLEEQAMTGRAGYLRHAATLVEDIAAVNDTAMDDGVTKDVLTTAKAESLYRTTADRQWLQSQLNRKMRDKPTDFWS